MSLVTIQNFAGYVRRELDELDAYSAQLCLDGASSAVVEYCGWHIAPSVSETVTVDGSGTRIQPLPTLNLTALTAVTEAAETLDVTKIDWSANGLLEKRSSLCCWTNRRRGVAANITHGYAATPSWVATVIYAAAARGFFTTPGVIQEAAGGESITYASSRAVSTPPGTVVLMDLEKKMLDRIRVPLAA